MSISPRPTWLMILNSCAVIVACLASFAYCVWVILTKSNQLLVLAAPLMLCVPLLIAAMQYRAVFRRSEIAARNVGKYLFIAGGLLAIFFAVMSYVYAGSGKEIEYEKLGFLIGLTAASLYLLYCGRTNQEWAKRLEEQGMESGSEVDQHSPPPSPLAPG